MRLSFYTYSYTDKLALPIEACHDRIARAGYSGIDVSGTHGMSDDPKSFDASQRKLTRETCAKLGLKVEAVITHAQLTDSLADGKGQPLDLKGTIDLAVDLGAPVATFHMGGYHPGLSREDEWKRTVAVLKDAVAYGDARHVSLAVDGIWLTWIVDSLDSLERLFDDVGGKTFGVNFDPSYLTLLGYDAVKFIARFKNRIRHVHLKDHRVTGSRVQDGLTYPEWTHLIPGQGEMDYARIFAALDRAGFAGSAAVECFTDMKFEEACDQGYAAMTSAAERGGVKFAK